ncbi:MAG: hypothetical protein Q7S87_10110 [Agitococcus sp.]|nr:hypothetical protein [Agitococcus sp.]MDO9179319.1 hypothetical protein [Agitococcus sp.]
MTTTMWLALAGFQVIFLAYVGAAYVLGKRLRGKNVARVLHNPQSFSRIWLDKRDSDGKITIYALTSSFECIQLAAEFEVQQVLVQLSNAGISVLPA